MPYVAQDDLILFTENTFSFMQGNVQSYALRLYKDFLGNDLISRQATSFHVGIFVDGTRVIQYSEPSTPGVSADLEVSPNGQLNFTIDSMQSTYLPSGEMEAEVSVVYENYYPQPKTYVFPRLSLGTVITNPDLNNGGDSGNGGGSEPSQGGGETTIIINKASVEFNIESVIGSNPTSAGYVSFDSHEPASVTEIVFKNLDTNGIRLTSLENFLQKRITNEGINGVITISDLADTNMYGIYKIESWERIDLLQGGGLDQDSDGIKLNVSLEALSTGPGVTKSIWEVGQSVTYTIDAHGLTNSAIQPNGILTYVDKHLDLSTGTIGDAAATGVFITYSPYQDSNVVIEVNGISVELGNGSKDKDAYFSGNGGLTATTIEEIRAGDQLYWNGLIARFDLEAGDQINMIYEAKAEDLR